MEDLKNKEMEQEDSNNEDIENSNNEYLEQESNINEKSYSEDEVNEIVQRRLARERKKFNKILDSDEFDKELIKREKAISLREMKADAKEFLSENNIPPVFIDLVNFDDRQKMEDSLKVIENIKNKYIEPWISEEVSKRFSGKTPKISVCNNFKSDPLEQAFKL